MAGATTPAKVDIGSIASPRTKGFSEAGCNLSSLGGQIFQLALLPRTPEYAARISRRRITTQGMARWSHLV